MSSWRFSDCLFLLLVIVKFFRSISSINCTTDIMELSTAIHIEFVNISKTQCILEWTIWPNANVTGVELNVKKLSADAVHRRSVTELGRYNTTWTITDLEVQTTYQVFIEVYFYDENSCKSDKQNFTTLADGVVQKTPIAYAAETMIVLSVITAWGLAVYLFINQWGNLRVTPERHPRYKHAQPKNIETIKVVKRANDSVIYKNYSRQMSFTMEKREKRIERMNTLRQLGIDPQTIDVIDLPIVENPPTPSTSSMPPPTISTITYQNSNLT